VIPTSPTTTSFPNSSRFHAFRRSFRKRSCKARSLLPVCDRRNGYNPSFRSRRSVMLVLSRKPGEKVVIDGGITVTVVEVQGNKVRIGIDAPGDVRIVRGELACWQDHQAPAAPPRDLSFPRMRKPLPA